MLAGTAAAVVVPAPAAHAATVRPVDVKIEAETRDAQHGTRIVNDAQASGGKAVARISRGDTLRYDGVDLGATPRDVSGFIVWRWAVSHAGTITVRLDSPTAAPALVANLAAGAVPVWSQSTVRWTPLLPDGSVAVGPHTLYLSFTSTSSRPFMKLDAFTVLKQTPIPMP